MSPIRKEVIIGDCRLLLGDCLEILPTLGKVDAVVTDPPYVGLKGNFEHFKTNNLAPCRITTKGVGDEWGASFDWLPEAKRLASRAVIAFCGYADVALLKNAANLDGWLVTWAFNNSAPSVRNAPWFRNEFAWVLKTGKATWRKIPTVIHHPKLNAGCAGSPERLLKNDGTAAHPTQKPIAVISELICPEFEVVLDPFMGSGTTGVACVKLGRKFIGIEIDEGYFEIACERIRKAYAQPDMFVEASKAEQPKQESLFGGEAAE
jgi:DNA modification methylase